jgi:hypothetical protein
VSGLAASGDTTAQAILAFLRSEGAAKMAHAGTTSLLDHLVGTYAILRRWDQPAWLQHAALIHSVYGTDAYRRQLLTRPRRKEVAAVAGERAERIAYLFCVTPRGPLLAGTHRWARDLPHAARGHALQPAGQAPLNGQAGRDELDALVLLHMANLAEQAHAGDGSPRRWLVTIRDLAELIIDSDSVTPPLFVAALAGFSAADETLTAQSYLRATSDPGPGRETGFALAAAACPVVPEPCVWQAFLASARGDDAAAVAWADQAARRLGELGTAWDRRLAFEEWGAVVKALQRARDQAAGASAKNVTDPRALYDAVVLQEPQADGPAMRQPDSATGRGRFSRYIDQLAGADGARAGAIYPELESRPWHDPNKFPLARYLQKHYAAVRAEILAIEGGSFSPESEPIRRSGDWEVAFFYERGRRHDDVCAACPVTARGIEAYPTVRTMAGLIYVSRMRPQTHIAAHRGPTNLRVRCHLGVKVPDGDCAIRVGDETRKWREGECLVFDDYFEHEAWNHTDEERIVLIVDLWHPGLSPTEVRLLEALHGYTDFHARRLSRYWAANAAARREAAG